MDNPLRQLPSMDRLLKDEAAGDLITSYGRNVTREALRVALDAARQWISQGGVAPLPAELLAAAVTYLRTHQQPSIRPVINATGVILHTTLGRAPLSEAAQQAILGVAAGYSTLEYELEEGKRGKRDNHIEALITKITGAQSALVVNNNASAVLLILAALAFNHEVIVSRGQLVEIGGGFRMPDVMATSGAKLIDVGATNCTRLDDYAQAITPQTAILMRVYASNFKQIGFTEQPELRDITALAHDRGLLAVDDLGSGALLDTAKYNLDHEPTVQESIKAGFDLVTFSGDKLIGGPQAGIIVGRSALIERLKTHPLARALRLDKLSLAGLFATLDHYRQGNAPAHVPVWQMIALEPEAIRRRAEAWAAQVGGEVLRAESTIGGGSLPGETLPTYVLALSVQQPDELATRLRSGPTPIITRIAHGRLLLDPRTVLPGQDGEVIRALERILSDAAQAG